MYVYSQYYTFSKGRGLVQLLCVWSSEGHSFIAGRFLHSAQNYVLKNSISFILISAISHSVRLSFTARSFIYLFLE